MGTDPKGSGNSTEFGFSFEDHGWRWDLMAFKHGSDVVRLESSVNQARQGGRPEDSAVGSFSDSDCLFICLAGCCLFGRR